MNNKKLLACFILAVLSLFSLASFAAAADEKGYLPKDRVVDDDFIAVSESVDVGGTVNGDVIMTGGSVNFSGKSSGDLLSAGGNVRLRGQNDGNIRAAGGNVFIEGSVGKNVTAAGGNLSLGEGSTILGNAYLAGGMVEIGGKIEKNLKVAGGSVILAGEVRGNVEIMSEQITTRPDAKIGGNLTYYSNNDLNIDKSVVAGEIIRKNIPIQNRKDEAFGAFMGAKLIGFFGILVLAYVLYRMFPRNAKNVLSLLFEKETWKMMAIGILALILIPISIILLMITLIGMPLALILIFSFVASMLISKAIASISLGFAINRRFKAREFTESFPWVDFILGYLILEVLMLIPFLGQLVAFLIFLWAFGGFMKYVYTGLQKDKNIS